MMIGILGRAARRIPQQRNVCRMTGVDYAPASDGFGVVRKLAQRIPAWERAKRLISILACVVMLMPLSATVFAQAGSTGGTIGKSDKSISGGEENTGHNNPILDKLKRSTNVDSNSAGTLPSVIRLNEHAIVNFSITLTKTGDKTYHGTWSHGYVSTFTVTSFTKDSLNMMRQDDPAIGSVSGTYTGRRSGNSAHGGAAISNGFRTTWDATWP